MLSVSFHGVSQYGTVNFIFVSAKKWWAAAQEEICLRSQKDVVRAALRVRLEQVVQAHDNELLDSDVTVGDLRIHVEAELGAGIIDRVTSRHPAARTHRPTSRFDSFTFRSSEASNL